MQKTFRTPRSLMLVGAVSLALAACNPEATPDTTADATADGSQATPAVADADEAAGAVEIEGLEGQKAQAGYMIGLQMAKSLEPISSEIDQEALFDALRTVLAGDTPLMTDEQAEQVAQAFGQHMQEKMEADQAAKAKENEEAGKAFLETNAGKPGIETTASGLQYEVLEKGDGPKPTAEDTVRVHYTGKLLDGTVFDDSTEAGEPVEFPLTRVVPGWAEGLQLMPVGSKYRLWIPGELGYGPMGTPGGPIGPNATLVFDVELIGIAPPEATADGEG